MQKDDLRYDAVKPLYEKGKIKSLSDIFRLVPKTNVGMDLKTKRMNLIGRNMGELKLQEMHQLADLFELTLDDIIKLAEADYSRIRRSKNK